MTARVVAAREPLRAAGVAAGAVVLGLAVALYPVTVLLTAVVILIAVLAVRAPALALGAAVLLFEFEGSVKIGLGLEHSPLPGDARFTGALMLDMSLAVAVAGLLVQDRLRAPRSVWSAADRLERAVIVVLGAWLALSVVQIVQGGDVGRGVHGFRLFQWYAVVALAALTVFRRHPWRDTAMRCVLAIGLIVAGYATLRVLLGPSHAERAFALSADTVTMYGRSFRAVGSFSSAVGLSSFAAPIAAFAVVLGLFVRRMTPGAWTVGALALIATVASYSRASLFGIALGLGCAVLAIFGASGMPRRRKIAALGAVLAIVGGAYGGLLLASRTSPALRERTSGVLHPWHDESVRLRTHTWRLAWDSAVAHPLGQGVGAVGGASSNSRNHIRTTDNSFLKVLVEQGFEGLALFAAGLIGAVLLLIRRLRRVGHDSRALGLAALAGFTTFLGMAVAGETVEQPGKVVAWGLLGIAVACAVDDPAPQAEELPA